MPAIPDIAPSERLISVNGLSMNVASCGRGPGLILLHGFPDHWRVWRPLMQRLSSEFTLLAPDQRGYNLTTRPPYVSDYAPAHLIGDLAALITALGDVSARIVAHDWGATLAFWLAIERPELVRCLTILNGAHPYLLQQAIWDDPLQRTASQYIQTLRSAAFEKSVTVDDGRSLAEAWFTGDLASGKLSRADYDACLEAWARPGAWPAMLNWYRAAPFDVPPPGAAAPSTRWTDGKDFEVKVPVQLIWGERDTVFTPAVLDRLAEHTPDLEIHRLPEAGHVPQRDAPDACAALIRGFSDRFL
jgi:epoxide hydrolase 4